MFARQGAIVFVGLMAANIFLYIYYVLVGRIVGVAGYGIVTALLSAVFLLSVPATVAATVIAKLAADLHAAGDDARLCRLAHVVDRVALLSGGAVCGAAVACSPMLEHFFHLATPAPILASGAVLGLTIVVFAQRGVLQGRHRFVAFGFSYIIDTVGRSILGPLGAIAFGVTGAIAGIVIGLIATATFNALAMRHGTEGETAPLALPIRGFLKSAAQIGVTMLAINVMLFYDTILVRHFFDAEIAGLYSAAALVARALYAAVGFIPIVLLPNASRRAAKGEEATHLLLGAVGVVLIVGSLAIAASVVAPSSLVRFVAGPAFTAAGPFVLPYVTALVALAAANAIANYKVGLGRFEQALPLLVVAIAQIVVVVVRHNSIHDVLMTILAGDTCALVVTLYRVRSPARVVLRPETTA